MADDPAQSLSREEIIDRLSAVAAYSGEVMLLGWDESHNSGMTAKFLIQEPDSGIHPMKQFTVRRGKRAGHRFVCLMFEVDDDDSIVNQDKRDVVEGAHKGQALARAAGRLSKNPDFHRYLQAVASTFWQENREQGFNDEQVASAYIRGACEVESRRELDTNTRAEALYRELHSAFVRWREGGE